MVSESLNIAPNKRNRFYAVLGLRSDTSSLFKGLLMKKVLSSVLALGLVGLTNLQAAVTMPTPTYTDIEGAAAIGFAIAITVGLLMQAKSFFR